jgi:hypothetical protein
MRILTILDKIDEYQLLFRPFSDKVAIVSARSSGADIRSFGFTLRLPSWIPTTARYRSRSDARVGLWRTTEAK